MLVMMLAGCLRLQAQVPSRENQVKAVFLYNFTQFVEWPAAAFDSGAAPLVIGVLGKNPFGNFLEQTVAGEQVNGHPVTVHYCNNEQEALSCHIVFINIDDAKKRKQVIQALKGKNILTVSDAPDFARLGGMIRLFTQVNKIRLQVNLDASKESELVLSSKLLKLADIYDRVKSN
jgi:hypothetical protein